MFSWDSIDDTDTIPLDANDNEIGDGWRNDATKNWVADEDEESFPNRNPQGDGWSVYGEYRGVFLQPTDKSVTRLDPTAKDVLLCSSSAIASYGRGLVKIPHHAWQTIHEDLVNSPWSTVRWQKDKTKIDPKVDKSIGEVNFNAKGIPGDDKRAWAIRLTFSSRNPGPFGDVATGSPSYSSKILIHKKSIESWVRKTFTNFQVGFTDTKGNYTQDFLDAMDVVINVTISHELGHCLALPHCNHAGCVMRDGKKHDYDFNPKTKDLTHDVTGIDAAHDFAYSATGVVGLVVSSFYVSAPEAADDDDGADASPTLTPSNGLYTAEAGDSHTANFTTNQAYSRVYWYVKAPGDTSYYGTNVETDSGDGSTTTTAQFSYSFPSGTSGDYQIMAYVYSGDNSIYETSYTVSVSLPTTAFTYTLSPSNSSYTATAGDSHTATLSMSAAPSAVDWYVQAPGGYARVLQHKDTSGGLTSQLSYSFPSGVAGDYNISVYGTSAQNGADMRTSYTVSVSLPGTTTTTPSTITTPSGPTSFDPVQGYASGIVGLYWGAPDSDGGATIIDYEYQYRSRKNSKHEWSDWTSWSSAGTSGFYLVYNLLSYVEYEFKMRAVNSEGAGAETGTVRRHVI